MTPEPKTETVATWQPVIGKMRIFICGSGEQDWFPVSKPFCSEFPNPLPEDLAIAESACEILREKYRDAVDSGPDLIRSVLESIGWVFDPLTRYPKTA